MDLHTKDPLLGKYDPLERVLLAHDFENGMQGWQTYCYGQEFNVAGQKIKIWDPEDPVIKEHGWEWRASTDRCSGLISPSFRITAESDRRCFLYLDSVVVSVTKVS